jgi:hypothetical protein
VKVKMNLKGSWVVSRAKGTANLQAFSREALTWKVIGGLREIILPIIENELSSWLLGPMVSRRMTGLSHESAFVWEMRFSRSMEEAVEKNPKQNKEEKAASSLQRGFYERASFFSTYNCCVLSCLL